jgi:hypothetical protein
MARAGADARHHIEFGARAFRGPAGKHAGAESTVASATRDSKEVDHRAAVDLL